jgi:hypothetical protein
MHKRDRELGKNRPEPIYLVIRVKFYSVIALLPDCVYLVRICHSTKMLGDSA